MRVSELLRDDTFAVKCREKVVDRWLKVAGVLLPSLHRKGAKWTLMKAVGNRFPARVTVNNHNSGGSQEENTKDVRELFF